MTIEEYFGDWMKVIDRAETIKIMNWLRKVDLNIICPALSNIFKAFKVCPYNKCRVVFIGLDPYPQKGVATGILFGNSKETPIDKLSPSLEIIKEAAINLEIPHNIITFDHSLESWAEQGILMLNSALTCEVNKVGSHTNIWRPFISKLIKNLSSKETGLISPRDTAFMGSIYYWCKRGKELTYKQARYAMKVLEQARSKGWEE